MEKPSNINTASLFFCSLTFAGLLNSSALLTVVTLPRRGGGALTSSGLVGMCRWMGFLVHDWTDYNGIFKRVTKMGLRSLGGWG